MKKHICLYLVLVIFGSCKTTSISKKYFNNSEVFKQNFTGFSLFDLAEKKIVFEQNSNKYFQPASNAKLLTFYAGLKVLGDSVPALKYIKKGDSLIFWGTGDPSLLHPDLPNSKILDFLKNRKEKLFYSETNNFQNPAGSGWMIDDYNDNYQAEINTFPIYGNVVRFSSKNQKLVASPLKIVSQSANSNNEKIIIRDFDHNIFSYPNGDIAKNFEQDVPFITSYKTIIELLADTLKKDVFLSNFSLPKYFSQIFSIKSDSLYKRMLLVSDNMIAEQIMLLVSKSDSLNTKKSIDYTLKTYLKDLPDKIRWVDGSGLSRYNLVTPRSLMKVLEYIYNEIPKERLYDLMPSKTAGIYAKSGSYSNNYNLSGYLIGQSGKTYAFSFLNNNYMNTTTEIRKEVERILVELQVKL